MIEITNSTWRRAARAKSITEPEAHRLWRLAERVSRRQPLKRGDERLVCLVPGFGASMRTTPQTVFRLIVPGQRSFVSGVVKGNHTPRQASAILWECGFHEDVFEWMRLNGVDPERGAPIRKRIVPDEIWEAL